MAVEVPCGRVGKVAEGGPHLGFLNMFAGALGHGCTRTFTKSLKFRAFL